MTKRNNHQEVVSNCITERKMGQFNFQMDTFDRLYNCVLVRNLGGEITYCNQGICDVFGRLETEIAGRKLGELIPDMDEKHLALDLERVELGEDVSEEWVGRRADGLKFQLKVRTIPMTDNGGKPNGFVSVGSNTVEDKSIDVGLKKRKDRFAAIFEGVGDGIVYTDKKGKVLEVNKSFAEITGIPGGDIIGRNAVFLVKKFISADQVPKLLKIIIKSISGQAIDDFELEYHGKVFEISVPFKEEIAEFTAIIRDVTERKHTEEALRESVEKFRTLAENLPGIIYIYDQYPDGKRVGHYFGEGFGDLLGKKLQSEIDKDVNVFFDHILPEDYKILQKATGEMEMTGGVVDQKYRVRVDEGKIKWFRSVGRAIPMDKGVVRRQGVMLDITDSKRIEELNHIIRDLALSISTTISLDDVLNLCLEAAIQATAMDCGGIYSVDRDTGELYLEHHVGLSQEYVEHISHYDSDTPSSQLVKAGKPIYTVHKNLGIKMDEIRLKEGLRAIAVIPLKHEGEVIGCLNIASRSLNKVSDFSRHALESMVSEISGTIARKRTEEALQESEERYRCLVDFNPAAIVVHCEGKVVYANESSAKLMGGASEKELIGELVFDFVHPDDRELVIERMKHIHQEGRFGEPIEEKFLRLDGEVIDVEVTGMPTTFKGKPAVQVVFWDITERKRVEEALRESVEKFRTLSENLPGIIYIYDQYPDGKRVGHHFGEGLGNLLGKKLQSEIDKDVNVFFNNILPEDYEILQKAAEKVEKTGGVLDQEYRVWVNDGKIKWFRSVGRAIPLGDGAMRWQGILLDITERKQAEDLQTAVYRISQAVDSTETLEELYRAVHEIILDVMPANNFYIALLNDEGNKLTFPYFVDLVDEVAVPRELGNGFTEYVLRTGESLFCDRDKQEELYLSGEAEVVGEPPMLWLGVPLKVENMTIGVMTVQQYSESDAYGKRELYMLEFVSNQIARAIARKRAEEALRESEEKYRIIVNNSLEGIYIAQRHILKFCNQRFAEMFGFDSPKDTIGKKVQEMVSPGSWATVDQEVKLREIGEKLLSHYEFTAQRIDGSEFEVETIGSRIVYQGQPAVQGVMRDISEKKQLEEQLRHSQKMEAVGRLAGGVAHDFNNLLTVITGHSDMALMALTENDPLHEDVMEIQNAARRAADLTSQLLAFSRKQTLKPKVVNINEIVLNMEKMLRRIIGENIELITRLEDDLRSVKVDTGQFEQVIVNMVVNAGDAMPKGGKLTVETSNADLGEEYCSIHPEVVPGKYVLIEINDTGVGMTEEVKDSIFEPFFTTKGIGRGTGLGLSMVYGIIKQSGGHIDVSTKVEEGTGFKIYLPRVSEKVESIRSIAKSYEVPRGTETILVVEDERTVLDLAVRTLSKLGYCVMDAKSGGEAFIMCEKMDKPVDLIISDMIMPKMGGVEFVRRVQEFWPNVKVLFMSGYAPDGINKNGDLESEFPYLKKPFRLNELALMVRNVLDS